MVIGAGLAGLAAADDLSRGGAEVEVVEARERVGGRTWSQVLPNGAVIELGAEFVLAGNSAVRALAQELGLALWDKGMRYGDREPRGGIGTTAAGLAEAVRAADRAVAALDGRRSVRELLDSLEIEPGAREAILARAEISSASSADDIPATDLAGLAHIDTEPAPSVAGGNQGLALGLAERLGEAVRLGDAAARVEWGGGGVRVETAAGHASVADAAVVAVPARVIERIEFVPPLPVGKRDAFARVRYGHAAKLFVPLREPAPVGAVMNVPERYWCWTATGPDEEAMPVVSCFCRLAGRARAPRRRRRSRRLARLARRPSTGPRARPGRRRALGLGRGSLGRRRLLDLAGSRSRGGALRAGRAARVRRRAHRRSLQRAHGGGDPQRPCGRGGSRPRPLRRA